ncbi:MAG TPA: PKD domain-containing protein [Thermoanaerobaculia bacterium]|jgi:PKD repeat protein|nr:PKD domain-containing protein [Thermoanaerobaculia bacterium]
MTRRVAVRAGTCLAFLVLLGAPLLGGRFRLSNPESPVYYRYAVIAGERIQLVEGTRVAGNLHSNGDVSTASGVLIDGDASTVGKITGPGTVTGTKREGAPSVSLPRLATAAELQAMADRKLQGDQTFNNAVVDDVIFVNGRVRIQGSLGGAGTILATGDVTLESSAAVPGPGTRISVVSLGSIALAEGRAFRGILYAGQDVQAGRGAQLEGVVLAGRRVHLNGDVRLTFVNFDSGPPVITLLSPAAGAFLSTAIPQITLSFSDDLSGVDPSTASFLLDGQDRTAGATVSATGLSFQPAQPLADGLHKIVVRIFDHSGKEASAEFTFTTDTVAPALRIASPGPTVDGDSTPAVTVEFSDAASGIDPETLEVEIDGVSIQSSCVLSESSAVCEPPELAEGRHTIVAEVADRAGNRTTAESSFDIVLDRKPPALRIVSPSVGLTVGDATPEIVLSYSDAGSEVDLATLSVVLDEQDLTAGCDVQPNKATCEPPPLAAGLHILKAAIADRRGFRAERERVFEISLQLALMIEAPAQGELTQASTVEVSGTISPEADSVSVNGIEGVPQNGIFVIADVPLHEGGNTLTAIARSEGGGIGTATVTVVRDTAAPRVVIAAPHAGLITTSPQIAVTGEYVDPLSSNADVAPPVVKVNGFVAKTELRTFSYDNLLLQPGENLIRVTVTDTAGNEGSAEVSVTLVQDAAQQIEKLLGDDQSGPVGQRLKDPLVMRLRDVIGNPLPGRRVLFEVTRGGGQVVAGGEEASKLSVSTDEQGLARVDFFLGRRAGAGNHEVTVTSAGFPGEITFSASATVSEPRRIVRAAGDDHTGAMVAAVSEPYPKPLLTQVFDGQGNPVQNVPVTYRVISGGGSFAGAETVTEVTNGQGLASATFTLGPQPGNMINLVEAGFDGLAELPVTFAITGMVLGPEEETAIVGLVLDNQDDPVPGVTLAVDHTDLTAVSDAQGRFRIAGVPVGTVKLKVDGKTTSRPGTWPYLEFHFTTISGVDNSLGMPIRLLPIDVAGGKLAGGPEEVVIQMKGVPGATLTVAPNSVTFPNGSKVGTVSFTQVHGDKVPMIAPLGSNFTVAFTVQPPGTRFDPPAVVTLPNIGLPPGSEVDLFSFDHDIGEFLSVGTATVTPDGLLLRSNPGTGISKAGWGGGVPPPPPLSDACQPGACTTCVDGRPVSKCGPCERCDGSQGCVIASLDGLQIFADSLEGEETSEFGLLSSSARLAARATTAARKITVGLNVPIQFRAVPPDKCCTSVSYRWDFKDGGSSTDQNPKHTFKQRKTYPVELVATCSSCPATKTETMDVEVIASIQINTVISNQFPGSRCNLLTATSVPGSNNPMLMGTLGGASTEVLLESKVVPKEALALARIGVRKVGSSSPIFEEKVSSLTSPTSLRFDAQPGRLRYEVVAGFDDNSSSGLQDSEIDQVFPHKIRVVTPQDVTESLEGIDGDEILLVGAAQDLTDYFLAKTAGVVNASLVPTTIAASDLAHPLGASWTSACVATTVRAAYGPTSPVADKLANSEKVEDLVKAALSSHATSIKAFFSSPSSPNTALFPAVLGGTWTWSGSVRSAGDWAKDGEMEIAGAFGAVNLKGEIREVEIRKSDLQVMKILYTGELAESYDFDITKPPIPILGLSFDVNRDGATMQAGHTTINPGGQVFRTSVNFSRIAGSEFDFEIP